jgi:hypothetical protein
VCGGIPSKKVAVNLGELIIRHILIKFMCLGLKKDLSASGYIFIYNHTLIYRYISLTMVGFQVLAEED